MIPREPIPPRTTSIEKALLYKERIGAFEAEPCFASNPVAVLAVPGADRATTKAALDAAVEGILELFNSAKQ